MSLPDLEFFASLFYGMKCSQRVPIWELNVLLPKFFILSWESLVFTPDQEVNRFWRTPVSKLLIGTKMWSYGSKMSKSLTVKHRLCLNKDCLPKALNRWVFVGSDTGWVTPDKRTRSAEAGPRERDKPRARRGWSGVVTDRRQVPLTKAVLLQWEDREEELGFKQAFTRVSLWPKG